MYTYDLKGKVVAGVSCGVFVAFAVLVTGNIYKIGLALVALLLLKDFISVMTTEYKVDEKGLWKKDVFSNLQVCDWHSLEFMTITKKNKEWVALVSEKEMSYLKKHIEGKRELLLEIISFARKNKDFAVHDEINHRYQLKLKLNDEGKLMK